MIIVYIAKKLFTKWKIAFILEKRLLVKFGKIFLTKSPLQIRYYTLIPEKFK